MNLLGLLPVWCYGLLATMFSSAPKEYQWILAILSPFAREIYVWEITKVCCKAANACDSEAKHEKAMICGHMAETRHAVFLSIILGGVATAESTYCIIGMDFLINIYHGLKIIRKSNSGQDGVFISITSLSILFSCIKFHRLLAQEDIERLVLTERIETLVPMSYIAIMVMAYYGPNARSLDQSSWPFGITNLQSRTSTNSSLTLDSYLESSISWASSSTASFFGCFAKSMWWKYCKNFKSNIGSSTFLLKPIC